MLCCGFLVHYLCPVKSALESCWPLCTPPQMNARRRWAHGWKLSLGSACWGCTASWGGMETQASNPRTPRHLNVTAGRDRSLGGKWSLLCGPKVDFKQLSGYLTHFYILKFYVQINIILNLHLPVHSSLNSFLFKDISTHAVFPNALSSVGGIREKLRTRIFQPQTIM